MTLVPDLDQKKDRVRALLDADHTYPTGDLVHVAERILGDRAALLAAAAAHPTPFYLFDRRGFAGALRAFREAFDARLAGHRPFYAVKSNHHPLVVEEAVRQGFGLDVSSGRELRQALATPVGDILFSGPAKSDEDLAHAVRHADRVTVQLDSFRELARLGAVAEAAGVPVRAGVRVATAHHGAWSKFGIPLADLARFWREARRHPRVDLRGIQFHLSWNRDAEPYQRIIADVARTLAQDLTAEERARIAFIDLGGGYKPHRLEGYYPAAHPLGEVIAAGDAFAGEETRFLPKHFVKDSIPLGDYAVAIGEAVDRCFRPLVDCAYFTEPGRIVSTFAMHLVLRVADRKSDDLVILDGGINMVGWERYLHIYCPVVDLTHPALKEIDVRLGGSLCDCEDLWGFHCFAERIEEGDVIVVPYQGAYTFCVAQDFIRPIPPVYEMPDP